MSDETNGQDSQTRQPVYRHQNFVPDAHSKEIIAYYLSRTTFLWNYLVEVSQVDYDNYLTEHRQKGPSQALDDALETKVWVLFEDIYRQDFDKTVPIKWVPFIERVRELPRTMTEQRLTELLVAYKSSALAENDGAVVYRNRPRRKTAKSAQSAVFVKGDFDFMSDNFIRCEAVKGYPVDIPLVGLSRHVADTITSDTLLRVMVIKPHESATKGESVDEFGPLQEDGMKAIFWLNS